MIISIHLQVGEKGKEAGLDLERRRMQFISAMSEKAKGGEEKLLFGDIV